MDGNWAINGLPDDYIVIIFMLTQIENYVTGMIDISNDVTQNFQVEGNNNYPNVRLDFKVSSQTVFSFNGQFTGSDTLQGTLSGKYTGAATLTREA
jgi:hypothetical protein